MLQILLGGLGLMLDYAHPHSSFERSGQKVRTPDAIVDSSRATCLDASLLLAELFVRPDQY